MGKGSLAAPVFDDLKGKRAVVTGGSRGIGAAIAQNLLDAGADVVAAARNPTEQTPPEAKFVKADLSAPDGVRRLADTALDHLGGVDIVVNNAGGIRALPSVLDIEEDWQYTVGINFLAAVRLNSALVPAMIDGGGGVIVNVSSSGTISPHPLFLHYAAAKSALEMYSRGLAAHLAPKGIRVLTVSPGMVATPGLDEAFVKISDQIGDTSVLDPETWTGNIPVGRIGRPHDIADVVSFLVSDRAAYITGTNLVIDGGMSAAL